MAADAPKNSPPSPSSSSPPSSSSNNSTSPPSPSPPNSSSPPPESPPPPSPPPPTPSPPPPSPPPSPSPSPPPPTPSPPPPSPPPPSSSPPPPSSSPPPPPPPSPSPPSPSKGSNQTHVHATHHTPPPPKLTRKIASPPTVPPPPKHSPPPPKSHSSDSNSNTDDGSNSNNISSQLPLILGLTAGVVLLLVIVISLVIVVCCKKKKKETMHHNNHMQYYSNSTPPQGDGGYGNAAGLDPAGHMNNGLEANNVPPYGGAAGPGGWQQPPSPQGKTPSTQGHMSYSSEMSSNVAGQPIPPPAHALPSSPLGLNQSSFSYEELSMATFGFSQGQMLGQGGFGYVHKGVLAGGKEVAVKSLKSGSGQGEREFQAEVETISRVHHRHLVSLVGYCVSGERRMLVYEFLPNKTLEYHLHEQGPMDWPTRLKIALGAAKGLAYLHEDCHPRIIHRDIKSANILLDYTFEAKVADFGLAKLTQDSNTHVSTRVMGTFGYLAPEYASSGKLTEKSDVFSFGVVLLELITGRRPLDLNSNMDESLVDWARPLCETAMETGNFRELVDPRLENNFVHLEMARMVACAGASIRHSARRRPKMRQIVRALEDDVPLDEVKGVVAATQSSRFSTTNDTAGAKYDSSSYSADMKMFRKMVMDSQDYSSSDFGNTGEYGHNPSSSSSSGSSGPIAPTQS